MLSLRAKILILFLGLAIVPLLVVAGYGYWQAFRLAEEMVAGSLQGPVGRTADQLEAGLRGMEEEVARLADAPETRALARGEMDEATWGAEVLEDLGPFAYVEVSAPGRGRLAAAGIRPSDDVRCLPHGASRLVRVRRGATGAEVGIQVEAGLWLDDLLTDHPSRMAGTLHVFHEGDGSVWLASSCEAMEHGVPRSLRASLAPAVGRARVTFESDGVAAMGVVRGLRVRPWTVVASTPSETFTSPLQRLQASYWLLTLLLAGTTGLAFSILLKRVVVSLEELTAAARRIGEGDLTPWLPPPTDDEVGRLSLAFSAMLERIREMMQRVDQSGRLAVVGQLTSYLAHEIRNPLSSIRMNLQGLKREAQRGRIPAEAGDAIDISLREVDRLTRSVTSVLQLGRPSSGPTETVRVHEVIQDAAELLNGEFQRAGVQVLLELDASADRVISIPGQLKGVFLNLMMNAVEAQPEGGRIEIRSRLITGRDGSPTVAVHLRDRGRGVAPELRERVFEPFFTTKGEGSGIGLSVAQRTVREQGGDLYLADLPETAPGCEFVVELPLAAIAPDERPRRVAQLPSWMDPATSTAGEGRRWRVGADDPVGPSGSEIEDARIRAFMALSNQDQGELH